MVDLLLLFQQISAEEAEEWTGERQGKGEKVPLEVRAFHTWMEAGITEKGMWIQIGPKPMPAMEGKKGD